MEPEGVVWSPGERSETKAKEDRLIAQYNPKRKKDWDLMGTKHRYGTQRDPRRSIGHGRSKTQAWKPVQFQQ